MRLKLVIKFISLLVFYTSSTFAFELSPNHYGGFGKLLKGKQTYKPSQVFPFFEAIQVNSKYEGLFDTEILPAILTEDTSMFYLYAKDFQLNGTLVSINDKSIDKQSISFTNFYANGDTIQLLEIKVSNTIIKADEAAKVHMTSDTEAGFWIYRANVSNQFTIYPTQSVYKKQDGFYRKYVLLSHCPKPINALSLELRNQSFEFNLDKGFQMQSFELPLVNKQTVYTAKVYVKGLLFGKEDIYVEPWKEHQIHLIPVINSDRITDYSSEYPFEIKNEDDYFSDLTLEHHNFSREINYSIQPFSKDYKEQIGFLQEESIQKYSSIVFDEVYPSRESLSRLMDLNIKTLGCFQREKYGYPDSYFTPENTAYVYEDGSRELLVYKQYNAVKFHSNQYLKQALIQHEYQLSLNEFPFKQSLLFVHLESTEELKDLNGLINQWNNNNQSPQLTMSNFNQFGKLFRNRNRTKLDHKMTVESPFRLNYKPKELVTVHSNWPVVLSDKSDEVLNNLKLSVFNPLSTSFKGITQFKHESQSLTHAEWVDGTTIKLQQYKPNHYFILLPNLEPFELKTIKLFENGYSGRHKVKSNYLALNKRNGLINWQFNGNKLTRKKEVLFNPIFYSGLSNIIPHSKEGYLKQKGDVFSEYVQHINTEQGDKMTVNTYVFHDMPFVKKIYELETTHPDGSMHLNFNILQSPSQYSIDKYYKEELGYSKFGNHNVIESKQSIFLINKTKILLSSPQNLRWQYNSTTFNTNEVGFIESSTNPTNLYLLLSGQIDDKASKSLTKHLKTYELNVILGSENDDLKLPLNTPIFLNSAKRLSADLQLFRIDNKKIEVVHIYPTEKDNQYMIELKNTSDSPENTAFIPRKNKSTVYECLFSGKKTGIIKGKIKFEPQELKTIRFSL